jgi:hypothetical protein
MFGRLPKELATKIAGVSALRDQQSWKTVNKAFSTLDPLSYTSLIEKLQDLVDILRLVKIEVPQDKNTALQLYNQLLAVHKETLYQKASVLLQNNQTTCNNYAHKIIAHLCQADAELAGRLLFQAVKIRNDAFALAFISHGANVNYTDPETGDTPLHKADILELQEPLLNANANPNKLNKAKISPWEYVRAFKRNLDAIKLFLASGKVDIDEKCSENRTALFESIRHNQESTTLFLLSAGANPLPKDKENESCMTLSNKGNIIATRNKALFDLHASLHRHKAKYFKLISPFSDGSHLEVKMITALFTDAIQPSKNCMSSLFGANTLSNINANKVALWLSQLSTALRSQSLQTCLQELRSQITSPNAGDLQERILFAEIFIPKRTGYVFKPVAEQKLECVF